MVSFKHKYISNPTVTPSDPVLVTAQDMTDALQVCMQCHLGDDALQSLLNLQKIFTQAAMNQKAADNLQSEPPQTKQTRLLAPKPTPAPETLLVVSPVGPQPLHDTAPPPMVTLSRPPPRLETPLYPSPQAPSDTAPIKVLTRPNGPGVSLPRRPLTVLTARAAAPTVTNAETTRHSHRMEDLNIKHQGLGEVEATSPIDNDKNRPVENTRRKKDFCAHTQEAILSSLDISQHRVSYQNLSRRQ